MERRKCMVGLQMSLQLSPPLMVLIKKKDCNIGFYRVQKIINGVP